jgi:hypothetical protein
LLSNRPAQDAIPCRFFLIYKWLSERFGTQKTMSPSTAPGFPSEQPSFAYISTQNPNDTGHDHPAYQPRFLSSNLQSNGMNVGSSTPIPYSHRPPRLEIDPCDGKPLWLKYHLVLTCRPRVPILVHPAVRSKYRRQSVTV